MREENTKWFLFILFGILQSVRRDLEFELYLRPEEARRQRVKVQRFYSPKPLAAWIVQNYLFLCNGNRRFDERNILRRDAVPRVVYPAPRYRICNTFWVNRLFYRTLRRITISVAPGRNNTGGLWNTEIALNSGGMTGQDQSPTEQCDRGTASRTLSIYPVYRQGRLKGGGNRPGRQILGWQIFKCRQTYLPLQTFLLPTYNLWYLVSRNVNIFLPQESLKYALNFQGSTASLLCASLIIVRASQTTVAGLPHRIPYDRSALIGFSYYPNLDINTFIFFNAL